MRQAARREAAEGAIASELAGRVRALEAEKQALESEVWQTWNEV